jgi:hypothetical protein
LIVFSCPRGPAPALRDRAEQRLEIVAFLTADVDHLLDRNPELLRLDAMDLATI